jgi:hypothetical protein
MSTFAETGRFYYSAFKAERTAKAVYFWLEKDPEFKVEFEDCKKQYIEKLEKEADRRAVEGVTSTRYTKSGEPYEYTEYSDTLMIFRLKALDPNKYRERHELTGPDGGPVLIKEVEVRLSNG